MHIINLLNQQNHSVDSVRDRLILSGEHFRLDLFTQVFTSNALAARHGMLFSLSLWDKSSAIAETSKHSLLD